MLFSFYQAVSEIGMILVLHRKTSQKFNVESNYKCSSPPQKQNPLQIGSNLSSNDTVTFGFTYFTVP